MSAIEINNLKKIYKSPKEKKEKVEALKGVSFSIEKGEFFGLLGPNGAGKTTLINILAGATNKTDGNIVVDGISIDDDHTAVKHKLGIVAQEISFDAFFTVQAALRFQFGYYDKPYDKEYCDEILEKLALKDKRNVKPRMLSGGMKRRFMIAKALVHQPDILILDEPTAGVDVELRHELYDLVRDLNKRGMTIVLTSHYLEEVELLCERVAILNEGNLIAMDHKKELKKRFKTARQFVISLAEPVKKIPASLKIFSPEKEGSTLTLTFNERDYNKILSVVAKSDLKIEHFQVIEPTLEDVFVSLTKK